MTDNRNTILAVILSGIVLVAWQYFYNVPQMEKQREAQKQAELQKPVQQAAPGTAPGGTTTVALRGIHASVGRWRWSRWRWLIRTRPTAPS